jgi:hypothetical protein
MLFATFDFLSHSDTRYISPGVIISTSVILLQGQILCIICPVGRAQHSTGARTSVSFHSTFKICYISVLMMVSYNVWTGSNVYILANNTHVTLNAAKPLVC